MARSTSTPGTTEQPSITTEKAPVDFNKLTPGSLSGVDLSVLDADQTKLYAEAAQARLQDMQASIYVDKRTGVVYVNGSLIGNVNRPINAKTVNPFKAKEEHIVGGTIELPSKLVNDGWTKAQANLLGALRINMAPHEGNGVNLVGQHGKNLIAAATALALVKGGLS